MRLCTRFFIGLVALFGLLIIMTAVIDVEMAHASSSGPQDGQTSVSGDCNYSLVSGAACSTRSITGK